MTQPPPPQPDPPAPEPDAPVPGEQTKRSKALLLYGGGLLVAVAVVAGLAIVFAGGGDDDDKPTPAGTATRTAADSTGAVTVEITATDFTFVKDVLTIPAGKPVVVKFKNDGDAPHSVHFRTEKGGAELADGATGPVTAGGSEAELRFTSPAAGTYYFECGVHPAQMNGTLAVGVAGAGSTAPATSTSTPATAVTGTPAAATSTTAPAATATAAPATSTPVPATNTVTPIGAFPSATVTIPVLTITPFPTITR
ncbi:MAG: cupredoxin domain-containing protein [Dehalococcoidia bacterium]